MKYELKDLFAIGNKMKLQFKMNFTILVNLEQK